jgi:hypothetical protein
VALLIVAVSVGLAGCGGGSAPEPSASTGGAAGNGEVFLVEGEGLTLQVAWRDEELITDFGGITLTFTKT